MPLLKCHSKQIEKAFEVKIQIAVWFAKGLIF